MDNGTGDDDVQATIDHAGIGKRPIKIGDADRRRLRRIDDIHDRDLRRTEAIPDSVAGDRGGCFAGLLANKGQPAAVKVHPSDAAAQCGGGDDRGTAGGVRGDNDEAVAGKRVDVTAIGLH